MSLRINTNVAALNSYNNLATNQNKLESAFQQLSSGLRINKAADDAAGLSISQGLTAQINGLTQAVSNANDGINVAQIADGALGTSQDILQRMRVLVNKAANIGTQDSGSWKAIQNEVVNLNTQLDNISGQTKFGQTRLLDGSYNWNFQVGADSGDTIRLDLSQASVASNQINGRDLNTDLNIAANGAAENLEGFNPWAANAHTQIAGMTDDSGAAPLAAAATGSVTRASNGGEGWVITDAANGAGNVIGKVTQNSNGSFNVYNTQGNSSELVGRFDGTYYDTASTLPTTGTLNNAAIIGTGNETLKTALDTAFGGTTAATAGQVNQLTWNTDHWDVMDGSGTAVKLGEVSISDGVYTITDADGNVAGRIDTTQTAEQVKENAATVTYSTPDANADLTMLQEAIDSISSFRSQIGAVQNQLSYTVSNLSTAITNVTASRSNLTDADLAEQVTAMTQSQILTQAATSVLAQANSAPQAILRLLQ